MKRSTLSPVEGLSDKQDLLVSYYLRHGDKKQAALKVGYSENSVKDAFKHPLVRAEIERRRLRLREVTQMDKEYLLQKLKEIIDPYLGDMIEVDPDGDPRIEWSRLTPEMRKLIGKFTIETRTSGQKYGRTKTTVKVDPHDKIAAIKEAAAILGLKVQQHEVNVSDSLIDTLTKRRQHLAEKKDDGNSGDSKPTGDGSGESE